MFASFTNHIKRVQIKVEYGQLHEMAPAFGGAGASKGSADLIMRTIQLDSRFTAYRRLAAGNVFERMKNAQPLLARKFNHQIGPL